MGNKVNKTELRCSIHPERIGFVIVTDWQGNSYPCYEYYVKLVKRREGK
jgi:hypothetical protein